MDHGPFFCEICQNTFGVGDQVSLEDGRKLPLCDLCWNQVPVGDRLKFLAEFRRNQAAEKAIEVLAEWVRERKDLDLFGTN